EYGCGGGPEPPGGCDSQARGCAGLDPGPGEWAAGDLPDRLPFRGLAAGRSRMPPEAESETGMDTRSEGIPCWPRSEDTGLWPNRSRRGAAVRRFGATGDDTRRSRLPGERWNQ